MKKAIITGGTGLVGKAVAKCLFSNGIEVLCLGRKPLTSSEIRNNFDAEVTYTDLAMDNIKNLPEKIKRMHWQIGDDCVFFNFAWGGAQKLTEGSIDEQLNNAVFAANAVKVSKKIGCNKFINAGTLEETYVEQHLKNKSVPYASSRTNYAIAKLAARDMCRMIAYLEKIDYVHTRLSVPLEPNLSMGTYIAKTLKDIYQGNPYEKPKNNQLFDIIFTDDVAQAYFLIGLHGKNKADYFIGTSKPTTLSDYFRQFDQVVRGVKVEESIQRGSQDHKFFDIQELYNDTGFIPTTNRLNLMGNIALS